MVKEWNGLELKKHAGCSEKLAGDMMCRTEIWKIEGISANADLNDVIEVAKAWMIKNGYQLWYVCGLKPGKDGIWRLTVSIEDRVFDEMYEKAKEESLALNG